MGGLIKLIIIKSMKWSLLDNKHRLFNLVSNNFDAEAINGKLKRWIEIGLDVD